MFVMVVECYHMQVQTMKTELIGRYSVGVYQCFEQSDGSDICPTSAAAF